jgi:hypothetical protein
MPGVYACAGTICQGVDAKRGATRMNAHWLPVVGWEGFYEVSDHGHVRSIDRTVCDGKRLRGRLLAPRDNGRGYPCVTLSRNNARKIVCVHRLVAQAFLPDSHFDGADVCHNDGSRTNNHVSNLRWGTRSDNITDTVIHGTHHNASKTRCPQDHPYSVQPNGRRYCRECKRLNSPAVLARQRELRKTRPMPDRAHGTVGGYKNWYCRCEPCKAAAAAADRRRRRVV